MDGCMDGRGAQIPSGRGSSSVWMGEWLSDRMDGWLDTWMHGWMHGWMDGRGARGDAQLWSLTLGTY